MPAAMNCIRRHGRAQRRRHKMDVAASVHSDLTNRVNTRCDWPTSRPQLWIGLLSYVYGTELRVNRRYSHDGSRRQCRALKNGGMSTLRQGLRSRSEAIRTHTLEYVSVDASTSLHLSETVKV